MSGYGLRMCRNM